METTLKKERRDRIMDVAIDLAMRGGFENVRQRDVALAAGVALGTLYKAFRSKEDILVAAVQRQAETLSARLAAKAIEGQDPLERIAGFYDTLTRAMCRKPHYARAVIRAMASGEPEITTNLASYREHISAMSIAALRGVGKLDPKLPADLPTPGEIKFAGYLQDVWFSALVGWSAGVLTQPQIGIHMRQLAHDLLAGIKLGE
jgi:AcrR family transcriptional regulator